MSASKAKGTDNPATRRAVVAGLAILAIAFVVGLAVSVSATSKDTATTTTTIPVVNFRDQIATSQRATQAVATTFLRSVRHCASATCMDNAAAAALSAEGALAAKFNPDTYPSIAQNAATAYSNLLVALQRTYLSIGSSTSKSQIEAALPSFVKGLPPLAASAVAVERLL